MKFLKKFITGSLIGALALFAGSFCLHPMQAQAMDISLEGQAVEGMHIMQVGDSLASALSTCTVDCTSKAPQATAAKKPNIDNGVTVLAFVSQADTLQFSEYASRPIYMAGIDPPSPDILFSVVKIE